MARHKDIIDIMAIEGSDRGTPNENGEYRQIRVVASPATTGDKFAIVHVFVPMGTSSPGHIHPDFEEIMYFEKATKVKINDQIYDVPAGGTYIARRGEWHEVMSSEDGDNNCFNVYLPFSEEFNLPKDAEEKMKAYLADQTF